MGYPGPSIQDIENARKAFEEREPRDLFYRAATELVEFTIRGESELSLTEALSVLLQTWNRPYYQYRKFDSQHFTEIEQLIFSHKEMLKEFRHKSIEDFTEHNRDLIMEVFVSFETVLGPVGASKCLHLLAPRFFPLWDRAIAHSYRLSLRKRGNNGENYFRFMKIVKEQCGSIVAAGFIDRNPIKALDEYNYCRYTKNWI